MGPLQAFLGLIVGETLQLRFGVEAGGVVYPKYCDDIFIFAVKFFNAASIRR
jgi:hypothetical protein